MFSPLQLQQPENQIKKVVFISTTMSHNEQKKLLIECGNFHIDILQLCTKYKCVILETRSYCKDPTIPQLEDGFLSAVI